MGNANYNGDFWVYDTGSLYIYHRLFTADVSGFDLYWTGGDFEHGGYSGRPSACGLFEWVYAEMGGVGNIYIYGSHSRETWNAYNYNYNVGIFEMFKMIYYEYPNLSWHDMGSSYHIYYTYDMTGQPEHGDLTDPKALYVGSWWRHYYTTARIVSPLGLWLNALSSYYKSVYTSSPY